MKGNNGSGNNEGRDGWETPQWLFDKLNSQYKFTFDCCADEDNKKCPACSEDFELMDGDYSKDICWMNPPFSKTKEMFIHFFKVIKKGVAIYRCDNMETKIWQEEIFPHATWIFIPNKRIAYEGMEGKGARFPSALIGFNVKPPKELKGCTLTNGKIRMVDIEKFFKELFGEDYKPLITEDLICFDTGWMEKKIITSRLDKLIEKYTLKSGKDNE